MSLRRFEQAGQTYRQSPTLAALKEQHRHMLQLLATVDLTEQAVIADEMGMLTRRDWSAAKNAAVHQLEKDHTYDELASLLGHGRNVVQRGLLAWRRRTGTPDWPAIGKRARRQLRAVDN